MTKGYILQDTETKDYVIEIDRAWETSQYKLTPDINKATIFSEEDVFWALKNISEDSGGTCYMKNFIQITIWLM